MNGRSVATMAAGVCVWLAALAALRYGVMETGPVAHPAGEDMLIVKLRAGVGLAIYWRLPGIAALVLALGASIAPRAVRLPFALCGLFAALAALMLYNADFGAVAAVISLLILPEPPMPRAPA